MHESVIRGRRHPTAELEKEASVERSEEASIDRQELDTRIGNAWRAHRRHWTSPAE
jgi:hypothetical protein